MRRTRSHRSRGNRDSSSTRFSSISSPSRPTSFEGLDINTNLGEGFGQWKVEGESEILPYVTSANIACGAHAGDPVLMESALEEARYYGLAVGAHIGYPDLAGFGRREIHLSPGELRALVLVQLGALASLANTFGVDITQVRPHGFLYRQISHDPRIAGIVAKAIAEFDKWLILIGPPGSSLLSAGERAGIRVAGEAWIDRAYGNNGQLLPHNHPRAILTNPEDILEQAHNIVHKRCVRSIEGSQVPLNCHTIHIHPKMADAYYIAEQLRIMLPDAKSLTCEPYPVDEHEPTELSIGNW